MDTVRNHTIVNADFVGNSIQVVVRAMTRSLCAITVRLLGNMPRAGQPYPGSLCSPTSQRWAFKADRLSVKQRTDGESPPRGRIEFAG